MTKNNLLKQLANLRITYAAWKKSHPYQQSEQFINSFLLLRSKFKAAGIAFPSRNIQLDNDAATFQHMVASPRSSVHFGEPFAPVRGSGQVDGPSISLQDFEPYLKDFIIASPVSWIVGGICERGSTKGDCDILNMLPSTEEIARIIDFRIFRMLPSRLAERVHSLWEERGARSPFTTCFPLYRLRLERIPDAELMPMAEHGVLSHSLPPKPSGEVSSSALPDTFSDIKLRTLHSKEQLKTAEKALKRDKITPGEFWLMSKPVRAYYPGKHQSIQLFLDIYDKFYSYPALSSKKFDGEHLSLHKIGDKVVIFSEDGSLLKRLNNLRKRIRSLDPEVVVLECELENWNYKTGQHFPRESVNTNVMDDNYTANVFDCLYFKGSIPVSLHEEIAFFKRNGRKEWKEKYLGNWKQKVSVNEYALDIDMDIHKLPCAIRFKFLELLGVEQETIFPPSGKDFLLNIVTHFADYNRKDLRKRTLGLRELPGSEGNVVSAASRSYKLTSGKRPYQMLKFHNSSLFTAMVIKVTETKALNGTVNVEWGLLPGRYQCKPGILRTVNDAVVASGGKSFSIKGNMVGPPGSSITIETETFNLILDKKTQTYDFSAWAPRCLGRSEKNTDSISRAENRALDDYCLQRKVIDVDGKVYYLPGKSGEEFPSK